MGGIRPDKFSLLSDMVEDESPEGLNEGPKVTVVTASKICPKSSSLEPLHVTLFGKRVFEAIITVRILRLRDCQITQMGPTTSDKSL